MIIHLLDFCRLLDKYPHHRLLNDYSARADWLRFTEPVTLSTRAVVLEFFSLPSSRLYKSSNFLIVAATWSVFCGIFGDQSLLTSKKCLY